MMHFKETDTLRVAYRETGPPDGRPVVLLHGFPYDVHAFTQVAPLLAAAGCRVIVPYLRGFGPTRFLSTERMRSGQQAALGRDLLQLMDALAIPAAVLAGFDWGGRAACVVAALWPERVRGLVSCGGYTIQNIPAAARPSSVEDEYRYWYQYYLHSERGRAGLERNRREFCLLLWRLWSPGWPFDIAQYERTAPSFDNPDFVEVVIHSYRHRHGLVPGEPQAEELERQLLRQPCITVPAVVLDGGSDGVMPAGGSASHRRFFTAAYSRRVLPGAGHNLPQEAPREFAAAVASLL